VHISLAAETLFSLGGFPVTNSFLTAVLVSLGLMLAAVFVRRQLGNLGNGFYNAVEMIVEGLESLVNSVISNAALAKRVLPLAGTIFLFVILANWVGLLPLVGSVGFTVNEPAAIHEQAAPAVDDHAYATGDTIAPEIGSAPAAEQPEAEHTAFVPLFRAAYSDLNMTLALAIVAMVMVQFYGLSVLGASYLGKFFNLKSPILAVVGLLEIVSEIVKVFSFSFRLFGNIFAGEVLLTVMASLVPFIGPVPFLGIEAFAGAIQALIFAMLTLVFIASATTPHEHEDDHAAHGAPAAAHAHSSPRSTPYSQLSSV
jgi:F-type H+-transporting ATPase subunit a